MTGSATVIECPRDAWQGLPQNIPTQEKVKYLSALIPLGFRRLDAVSFVSPKHVPQMADSEAVMQKLSPVKLPSGETPEIIGIIVNAQRLERPPAPLREPPHPCRCPISASHRRANSNVALSESRQL